MDLIEKVARALCKGDGVDPDQVGGTWDCGKLSRNKAAWNGWVGPAETAIETINQHATLII